MYLVNYRSLLLRYFPNLFGLKL